MPFEKVVEAVVKERDLNPNPLFEVMFVWQNTPEESDSTFGDRTLSREDIEYNTSKFYLTFIIKETASALDVSVEYCRDLFCKPTIKRIVAHFKELLGSIVKQPHQKIGLLSCLQ